MKARLQLVVGCEEPSCKASAHATADGYVGLGPFGGPLLYRNILFNVDGWVAVRSRHSEGVVAAWCPEHASKVPQ